MVGGVAAPLPHRLLRALVVSLAVCSSISVLSSAPTSTMTAVRYSQNIRMMIPASAP